MKERIEMVLFDLGGVLVDLNGPPVNPKWINTPKQSKDPINDWSSCSAIYAFETGKMTPDEFARSAIDEFDLDVQPAEFLAHFTRWPRLSPGAPDLIKRLRPDVKKSVLSNTNTLHWQQEMLDTGFDRLFDHCFASFKTGFFKPEKEAYLDVCETMQTSPKTVLFLDDKLENVEAARAIGMSSERVNGGAEHATKILSGFDLLI